MHNENMIQDTRNCSKHVLAHFSSKFEAFCKSLHNFCKITSKVTQKNLVLAGMEGKDLGPKFCLGIDLRVLEGQISWSLFSDSIFDPSVIGATVYLLNRVHTDQYPVYFFSTRFRLYTEQGAGSREPHLVLFQGLSMHR